LSYRDEIGHILEGIETAHGRKTERAITFVRSGSFDIRVAVFEPAPYREHTFDLSGGLTPRTRKAIEEWFEPIVHTNGLG
jgi:hypothetical protein